MPKIRSWRILEVFELFQTELSGQTETKGGMTKHDADAVQDGERYYTL